MGIEVKEINKSNIGNQINSKGFLLANFDKLLTWARTGSLWANDFWFGMLWS